VLNITLMVGYLSYYETWRDLRGGGFELWGLVKEGGLVLDAVV
jgi:hypothetical protein